MAKKKKESAEGGEEEAPKGKKKLIIMVFVIVLIGGFAAKTVLLKPKPPTSAQVADAAKLDRASSSRTCAPRTTISRASRCPADVPRRKGAKAAATTTTTTTTVPDSPAAAGPVDSLDAITINLAAGHYLKVGLALQVPTGLDPTTVKTTENWEAIALKTVIDTLSGQTIDALSAQRQAEENSIGDTVCRKTDGQGPRRSTSPTS